MDLRFRSVFKTWRTGLYGKAAWIILNSTIVDMKEMAGASGKAARYLEVERACDGEITIVAAQASNRFIDITTEPLPYDFKRCSFSRYDDGKFREYLASRVKRMTKGIFSEWKRDSGLKLKLGDIECYLTVSNAYAVYDALLGRDVNKHFPKELVELVVGTPADPMTAELERARREAEEEAKREYKEELDELKRSSNLAYRKAENEWMEKSNMIKQRLREATDELERSYNKKIAQIRKDFSAGA